MTPKQMYSELAKIAGHECGDGRSFCTSRRISKEHIQIIQNRILALLEKLNYQRAQRDFRRAYSEQVDRASLTRLRMAQRLREQDLRLAQQHRGSRLIPTPPTFSVMDMHQAEARGDDVLGDFTREFFGAPNVLTEPGGESAF